MQETYEVSPILLKCWENSADLYGNMKALCLYHFHLNTLLFYTFLQSLEIQEKYSLSTRYVL